MGAFNLSTGQGWMRVCEFQASPTTYQIPGSPGLHRETQSLKQKQNKHPGFDLLKGPQATSANGSRNKRDPRLTQQGRSCADR